MNKGKTMKLVNTKSNVSFVTGNCKNNQVPTHYLKSTKKVVTINDIKCETYMNPERTVYTVINYDGQWLYTKTHDLQKHKSYTVVERKSNITK